jgi:hypothetical protein
MLEVWLLNIKIIKSNYKVKGYIKCMLTYGGVSSVEGTEFLDQETDRLILKKDFSPCWLLQWFTHSEV